MSLNRCEFIGNLGADPEIRTTQSGDKCANLRIAVTEKWKSREGEARERTEWVSVVIWGPLAGVAERFLRKGSKIYVAGKWQTRKWTDQSGNDRYSTECVVQGFDSKLIMLDGKPTGDRGDGYGGQQSQQQSRSDGYGSGGRPSSGDYGDDIPFAPEVRG